MKFEKALKQESTDRTAQHLQTAKILGVIFVLVFITDVILLMTIGFVPRLLVLALVFGPGALHAFWKSRQGNEVLWEKWERRWKDRKKAYVVSRALLSALVASLVFWMAGGEASAAIGGGAATLALELINTPTHWRVMNYYLAEFKEEQKEPLIQ